MISCTATDDKKRHNYFLNKILRKTTHIKNHHRIILIGTGESGKSTFVKQMRLISNRNKTFDDGFRLRCKPIIYRNIVQSISATLKYLKPQNLPSGNMATDQDKQEILTIQTEIDSAPDRILFHVGQDAMSRNIFFDRCVRITRDKVFQEALKNGHEYMLLDSAPHFLSRLEEIRNMNYRPTDDDVLQCRTKTLGIHIELITYNNITFELVDVGGQRDQRSKWIEAMSDGVTAVIFLADISAYDMALEEDHTVNRLKESISLLQEVWRKNPLRDKSIILFLNKQDKLEMKIRLGLTKVEDYFPEYRIEKSRFLYCFLRDLVQLGDRYSKRSLSVWNTYFANFLPRGSETFYDKPFKESGTASNQRRMSIVSRNEEEFLSGKAIIEKMFGDGAIYKMFSQLTPDLSDDEAIVRIVSNDSFVGLHNSLFAIPFYRLISATFFFQCSFLMPCEQTGNRHIYPYPTTAIDRRNIDRVFDSCKDIMQGKILTEIMS